MPNVSLTAAQLGNPSNIRLPPLGRAWIQGSLIQPSWNETDENYTSATCSFLYQGDPVRYDIGFRINIEFEWNAKEGAKCIENQVLCREGEMSLEMFRDLILPLIDTDKLSPISLRENSFTLLTVDGLPTISPQQPPPDAIYQDIPSDIALPLVLRSDLRRYQINAGTFYMDVVTISNSNDPSKSNSNTLYAYKHHGPFPLRGASDDGLLAELKLLERVYSPHVLRPAFVVADSSESASKRLRFRGYLVPFLPAGSLLRVMQELSEPSGRPNSHVPADRKKLMLRPKQVGDSRPVSAPTAVRLPPSNLAWSLKLTWAIEATAGICALHEQGIYTGDVKTSNILLDQAGHLQIIDFNVFPVGGYTSEFVGPEFGTLSSALLRSGARDVFALGMVLWMIAEEICDFGREVEFVKPELVWRDHGCDGVDQGKGETPRWFRDLVENCLEEESRRPSARDVLEVLRDVH